MADNTVLNAPNIAGGDTFATDDLGGGVKVPRVKLIFGDDGVSNGDVSAANPLPVTLVSSSGTGVYHRVATGDNNAFNFQATPGQVFGVQGFNNAAYPVYIKLYDKGTAPNPAVDNPVRVVGAQAGLRFDDDIPTGMLFHVGISIAIVKGIADHDNTPVLASDCVVDVDYK
jgi:hypothetical protein